MRPAYHALYKLRQWDIMREQQLEREPWCRMCRDAGRQTKANTADHIVPHRGDRRLFFDRSNLQSLCQIHHVEKIRLEAGGKPKVAVGTDGWPRC